MKEEIKKKLLVGLSRYVPEPAVEEVVALLMSHTIELRITKPRSSILGDYRPPHHKKNFHRISVNGDLNPYAFLITFLHEFAHLEAHITHGHKILPHGMEWKKSYVDHLSSFLKPEIFPQDIIHALNINIYDPPASSCSDDRLIRILRGYDDNPKGIFLEQLPEGTIFRLENGLILLKGPIVRKRYRCKALNRKGEYLVSPIATVYPEVA